MKYVIFKIDFTLLNICIKNKYIEPQGWTYANNFSLNKTKNKKYHNVETFPKSNIKIIERDKIDTSSTQIHDD